VDEGRAFCCGGTEGWEIRESDEVWFGYEETAAEGEAPAWDTGVP